SCKTQYTDDSLSFCLQDGTPLIPNDSDPSTVGFGETETIVGRRAEPTHWQQSREIGILVSPSKKSSNWLLMVAILVLLLVILVGGAGAALYFFLRPGRTVANNTLVLTPTPANKVNTNSNTMRPTPSPTANTNATALSPTPTPVAVD